jgi:hypothetical protein
MIAGCRGRHPIHRARRLDMHARGLADEASEFEFHNRAIVPRLNQPTYSRARCACDESKSFGGSTPASTRALTFLDVRVGACERLFEHADSLTRRDEQPVDA